jgi:hypothetical protein
MRIKITFEIRVQTNLDLSRCVQQVLRFLFVHKTQSGIKCRKTRPRTAFADKRAKTVSFSNPVVIMCVEFTKSETWVARTCSGVT